MAEAGQQKVLCRFVTKLADERYKLDESAVGDVAIPAGATRYALSKTVKALLGHDFQGDEEDQASDKKDGSAKGNPIFDFLVEGELLRSEIARHLEKRGLSVERTLVVEYFLAIEPPEPNVDVPQPDWVCSVKGATCQTHQQDSAAQGRGRGKRSSSNTPGQKDTTDLLFSGCYDGTLNVHGAGTGTSEGEGGEQYYSAPVHGEAVSALCVFNISDDGDDGEGEADGQSQQVLVTASKDNSMKGWFLTSSSESSAKGRKSSKAKKKSQVGLSQVFEFVGHTGSVESLAASPGSCRFCSGGWDHKIKVWITDGEDLAGAKMNAKKQKISKEEGEEGEGGVKGLEQVETASFDGHKHCVSALSWPEENLICSTSWDSTVKCWDVSKGQVISNLIQESALFCLDASRDAVHSGNLSLAFGGTDGNVSVWDPREHRKDQKLASVKLLKSHKAIVSDVSWSSDSHFHLASCDYEGVVKVWDLRSPMPLHSLHLHEDKALCLDWFKNTLASGGADKKVSLQVINTS